MAKVILYEDIQSVEIVINTPKVQYRISNGDIHCMLIGGHKFEITLDTLDKINKSIDLRGNKNGRVQWYGIRR